MRPLREEEKEVVRKLLSATPSLSNLLHELDAALVEDMADGGMGSIQFEGSLVPASRLAREVASASFRDGDGVIVSVALNVDQHGHLFEVDFWKVDFSPLLQYPRAGELIIEERRLDG